MLDPTSDEEGPIAAKNSPRTEQQGPRHDQGWISRYDMSAFEGTTIRDTCLQEQPHICVTVPANLRRKEWVAFLLLT